MNQINNNYDKMVKVSPIQTSKTSHAHNIVNKLPIGPKIILINNRYQPVKIIGKGSFGKVYQSLDYLDSHKTVAIKIIHGDNECDNDDNSYEREISFLNLIGKKDNIIELKNSFTNGKYKCLVFEKADCCLRTFISHNNYFEPQMIKQFISQICRGLYHIHSAGYIHSDLKPDNIVVFRTLNSFQLKIIDFGCVRRINDIPIEYSSVYFTTRWFRSPEIILNHVSDLNQSSDIWAVGCILYQFITNKYLFTGLNNQDMLNWFQIFLGKIPHEILKKNSETFENYYITEDDEFYSNEEEEIINYNFYDNDLYIQDNLRNLKKISHEVNVEETTSTFDYNLKSYLKNQLLFKYFPSNSVVSFENIVQDSTLLYLLKNILLYNPYQRLNAADILELLSSSTSSESESSSEYSDNNCSESQS